MPNRNEAVFFDIDGTLVHGLVQEAFIWHLVKRRLMPVPDFIRLIVGLLAYKLGVLRDPTRLFEKGIAYADGRTHAELDAIIGEWIAPEMKKRVSPEAQAIILDHKQNGRRIVLLSSIIQPLVEAIGKQIGADACIGTPMESSGGRYTGHLDGSITHGKEKVTKAELFLQSQSLAWADAWAYADHASDRFLLERVGHPYAVNPSKSMRRIASDKHWPILMLR